MVRYIDPDSVHKSIGKFVLADGYDFVIDLDKSHGSWLVDKRNGKEYLDMFSCFASMPIGWNHPGILEMEKEFGRISLNNITNSDLYTSEMAGAIETIANIAKPDYFNHMFFIAGGSLAVENALKTAMDWKVRKNWKTGAVPDREEKGHRIAHLREAFHGRTGYTMSLTNTDPVKTELFTKFDWPRLSCPKLNFPVDEKINEHVGNVEDRAVKELHQANEENKNDIAAVIMEPIQGEGGDNHFRPEFFKKIRKAADEIDAMLIFDEVQSGAGLTGKMWAHQHFDVEPDIIAFGKKMQICGIMANSKAEEVEDNVFEMSSRINSTWGGNLIDMVRGAKYLEIIEEEKLVENAEKVGKYFLKGLHELYDDIRVTNVRGRGLMCAFSLPDTETRDAFRAEATKLGCFTLASGTESVRFRPMLNLSKEEADTALEILKKALKRI